METYAHTSNESTAPPEVEAEGVDQSGNSGVEYEVVNDEGKVVMRTNREIMDDTGSQKLTMDEIEAMKREKSGSGKNVIAKILESHSTLDQKTAFGLAKYTLRKAKKYLRRFSVLPVDVPLLVDFVLNEKEPAKIMEIREEMLALIGSWSNVHYSGSTQKVLDENSGPWMEEGRWLVVDETGGLLVAAMAERMGILHPSYDEITSNEKAGSKDEIERGDHGVTNGNRSLKAIPKSVELQNRSMSAKSNTITIIHANTQPNLSLLTYFDFDPTSPTLSHPLHEHLKSVSWLQLLSPNKDSAYTEPEHIADGTLQTLKSGKKSNYFRKRRRWERVRTVVDETRAGGFDGLTVASVMSPADILHRLVPLLRGAAQVVVYSPNIEPLAELADYYSTARRTAFLTNPPAKESFPNEDFPLDPTLLLAPAVYTSRCRNWQVLPGRTHPLMTGRGGAEGYIFTATRVLPAEGKVEARGTFKRRKKGADVIVGSPASQTISSTPKSNDPS